MEPSEKVIEKIESGAFSNLPQLKFTDSEKSGKSKKNNKSTKQPASDSVKADLKAIVKASNAEINGTAKPDEAKAPKVKVEKAPKSDIAAFPIKTTINAYGFIGLGKSELRALGLTVINQKGVKPKLAAEVPIEISSYDEATQVLTVKIL
jgi:hypothetical protein